MTKARAPRRPPVDVLLEGRAEGEGALASVWREDLRRLLEALGLKRRGVTLVLTDDTHIRALNATWRGEDHATDILSFPSDELDPNEPVRKSGGSLGDLVVSVETATRDAAALGRDTDELGAFLLVHGALHLLGHDHGEPDEARRMKAEEDRLFAAIRPGCLRPPTPY